MTVLPLLAQSSTPHTLTGDFRFHSQFQSKFVPYARDILVYLPPQYATQPRRRFPVLYLHDGQNLFDGATSFIPGKEWQVDETAQKLIRTGAIAPLIIVGIYNTGNHRIDEYTPTRDPKTGHGGDADAYGRMLTRELKPFIDRTYRTHRSGTNTGLGGSSLGALVTLYLGMKYPHVFGKLAVMSPSVWWNNRIILRRVAEMHGKPNARIWLDIGTGEGERTVQDARDLRDALVAKGFVEGRDLAYLEAQGAGHNELAWAHRVADLLQFLYPCR